MAIKVINKFNMNRVLDMGQNLNRIYLDQVIPTRALFLITNFGVLEDSKIKYKINSKTLTD